MSIIEFAAKEQPSATGAAICKHCKHEWIATAPVGAFSLECPTCSTFRGVFKYPYGAPDGAETYQCNCGTDDFFIFRREGCRNGAVYCRGCGKEATGWFE